MHERNGEDSNMLVTDSAKTKQKQLETCSIEATESDGFGEQKQQLVTSSIESKVFDKLSVITDVDFNDFDDSTNGLLEVPQNEGCDILNRGLLDSSPIQGIRLDSLVVKRGMSFTGTNLVTSEWVSNYNPRRILILSFDPGGNTTTVSSGHDINNGYNVQNVHSSTVLALAEIAATLSGLSLSRTRNTDTNANTCFIGHLPNSSLIGTGDITSLKRARIQGCDLSPLINPLYIQCLQKTSQYVTHVAASSTFMLFGNYIDMLQGNLNGLQKAHLRAILLEQKQQYVLPFLTKAGVVNHDYNGNSSYGLGKPFTRNPLENYLLFSFVSGGVHNDVMDDVRTRTYRKLFHLEQLNSIKEDVSKVIVDPWFSRERKLVDYCIRLQGILVFDGRLP
ncbi:hypothetical protein V6N11_076639 [Hibiscus sabdariffa]